jgi:hypothetical protein
MPAAAPLDLMKVAISPSGAMNSSCQMPRSPTVPQKLA